MAVRSGFEQTIQGLTIRKDTEARLIYTFDWSEWLPTGDSIASSLYTITARANDPDPLAIHTQGTQGKRIKERQRVEGNKPSLPEIVPGQIKIEIKKPIEKSSETIVKHRIRLDRNKNLIIDRYVQTPNGFSPFDDDFNKIINKHKVYSEDFVYTKKKTNDFPSLYENYLKDRYDGIVYSDSEEDQSNVSSHLKNFQSSYKQFLKHKRSHPDANVISIWLGIEIK